MASAAVDLQPSVVMRVASLPLVSSTYDLVSSAYVSTKDQHPYLKSVCEIAEKGVKTMTSVAMTSVLPIMQKLEPQSEFCFSPQSLVPGVGHSGTGL